MANSVPHSNKLQFIITTKKMSWLDGEHTVFGKVIKGLDMMKRIEDVGTPLGKTTKVTKRGGHDGCRTSARQWHGSGMAEDLTVLSNVSWYRFRNAE